VAPDYLDVEYVTLFARHRGRFTNRPYTGTCDRLGHGRGMPRPYKQYAGATNERADAVRVGNPDWGV